MSVFIESLSVCDNKAYSSYRENGGLLPMARYEEFMAIRDTVQVDRISSTGLIQASVIADFAGLKLTQQEIIMYGYLREKKDLCKLSDQKLLAEILLMQGELNEYQRFTAAYPNIFNI